MFTLPMHYVDYDKTKKVPLLFLQIFLSQHNHTRQSLIDNQEHQKLLIS